MPTTEEASQSLFVEIRVKTDALIAIEASERTLVVLLDDDQPVPELPKDWMGFEVSFRQLSKEARRELAVSLGVV